jgi:hypothetical protein
MATQRDIALQMVAQLRLLDPSASAEVGTPERKIIDTVAQQNADSQIDLVALRRALDLDSKYGANLDRFLDLFGFGRIKASYATGFVVFSRLTPATADILIPAGTQVATPLTSAPDDTSIGSVYATTTAATLPAGATESPPIPIRANLVGANSNAATGDITQVVGNPVMGAPSVTNPTPVRGGVDAESDDEYKTRFRNTVFRNLSGTKDQYLALAISTAFSTKANVIGPISRYREYVQVPPVADNASYDVNNDTIPEAGGGNAGEFTTALSTVPYAKGLWTSLPIFVSDSLSELSIFYQNGTDFRVNTDATRYRGDTKRLGDTSLGLQLSDSRTTYQPNVTFTNVYTGTDPNVQAVAPGDVVLFEFAYLSQASRNDIANNVTNAVDVYVDGTNPTLASTITIKPPTSSIFVDDPTSKYHYENYRRVGDAAKRPLLGNVLMPLYWQPIIDVPAQIVVNGNTYTKGVHYWGVQDVSSVGRTISARDGIEWSTDIPGRLAADPVAGPYTGSLIINQPTNTPVEIEDYIYDKNIVDLQTALEGSRQITTDCLAHGATIRYFKLDVTLMYIEGLSIAGINQAARDNVDAALKSGYFGSAVQLSDLLQTIHNTAYIDNVRWSADIPGQTTLARVYETDVNGKPLLNVSVDRIRTGTATVAEIQGLYLTGAPTGGSFTVTNPVNGQTATVLASTLTATGLQTALTGIGFGVTVTEDARSTTGVNYPIRSFRITYSAAGARPLPTVSGVGLLGGSRVFNSDFFLRDNELAALATGLYVPPTGLGDTVPGLIIRPRAQNTFVR